MTKAQRDGKLLRKRAWTTPKSVLVFPRAMSLPVYTGIVLRLLAQFKYKDLYVRDGYILQP